MVVQCYWALVNSSVDTAFAKKYFGIIIAGAQIGSILGPTVAIQAVYIGIPALYLGGALTMFFMVLAMYYYIDKFSPVEEHADELPVDEGENANVSREVEKEEVGETKENEPIPSPPTITTPATASSSILQQPLSYITTIFTNLFPTPLKKHLKPRVVGPDEGVLEGFYLFMKYDYVKGIFAISSFSMVQVTIIDYMMKVRYTLSALHYIMTQYTLYSIVQYSRYTHVYNISISLYIIMRTRTGPGHGAVPAPAPGRLPGRLTGLRLLHGIHMHYYIVYTSIHSV